MIISNTVYANTIEDANWNMWHGVQDTLILGEISKIENDIAIVKVEKCLSGKSQLEAGDCIIVSINRDGTSWECNWQPFEVTSLDYTSLEFESADESSPLVVAWLNFVRSDGRVNDFNFIYHDDMIKKVQAKGIFDDRKIVEEIIHETKVTDFTINMSFQKIDILLNWEL